jgi:hypothetical protein
MPRSTSSARPAPPAAATPSARASTTSPPRDPSWAISRIRSGRSWAETRRRPPRRCRGKAC